MFDRREVLRFTAALAGASLLPAIGAAVAAETAGGGKNLVVLLAPEPASLLRNSTNPAVLVSLNTNDGLIGYDDDFAPVPRLAESWSQSDDGKVVTLNLRKGVKWHDGKPFTSADAKFSIELAKKSSPQAATTFAHLSEVEAVDEHTVVLKFAHASQALWSVLDGGKTQILPAHLYEGADPVTNPYNNKPVGTGPYVFREWVRGSHLILDRNPDYWDQGKPLLDRVTFRFIADAAARGIALEAGEAHYAPLPALPLVETKRVQGSPGKLVVEKRGWESFAPIYFFQFNLEREPFKDVRVRQAFAYAIDRELIIRSAFLGFGTPATGPVPSYQGRFYTPDTPRYPHDPAKAEELLDAAGLTRGADGVRLRIDHLPLPFGDEYVRAAQLIQQQLRKVGVEVELKNFDIGAWISKTQKEVDYDTFTSFEAAFADPQIGVYRRYWSKANRTPKGGNSAGYVSARADELIEASLIEADGEKRVAIIRELQKLVETDLPSISLIELEFSRILSADLEGADLTPFGTFAALTDLKFKA